MLSFMGPYIGNSGPLILTYGRANTLVEDGAVKKRILRQRKFHMRVMGWSRDTRGLQRLDLPGMPFKL